MARRLCAQSDLPPRMTDLASVPPTLLGYLECGFLIAPSRAQPLPLRKFLKELELPQKFAVLLCVPLIQYGIGRELPHQLPNLRRQRIAVIRRRRKRRQPPIQTSLHERVVVQRVVHPPRPRALDVALADAAQLWEYSLRFGESSASHLLSDRLRAFRGLFVSHVEARSVPACIKAWLARIGEHAGGCERLGPFG